MRLAAALPATSSRAHRTTTRQVALYAEGIRRATGEPAEAALLWI